MKIYVQVENGKKKAVEDKWIKPEIIEIKDKTLIEHINDLHQENANLNDKIDILDAKIKSLLKIIMNDVGGEK